MAESNIADTSPFFTGTYLPSGDPAVFNDVVPSDTWNLKFTSSSPNEGTISKVTVDLVD